MNCRVNIIPATASQTQNVVRRTEVGTNSIGSLPELMDRSVACLEYCAIILDGSFGAGRINVENICNWKRRFGMCFRIYECAQILCTIVQRKPLARSALSWKSALKTHLMRSEAESFVWGVLHTSTKQNRDKRNAWKTQRAWYVICRLHFPVCVASIVNKIPVPWHAICVLRKDRRAKVLSAEKENFSSICNHKKNYEISLMRKLYYC